MIKSILLAGTIILSAGGAVASFGAAPGDQQNTDRQFRTDINPGLLYWQAFGALPRLEEAQGKQLAEFTEQLAKWSQGSSVTWSIKLPADARSLVSRYDRSLRLLQRARLSTVPCDWGADLADGPDMLVPDTRGVRELTKVSLLEAAVQLESGSVDESVDTLLSCLVLARHFAQDGTLVSVMLQQAVEAQFVDYVGAELGRYPAVAVDRLRAGLTRLPPRVPVLLSVENERNFQRWMTAQLDRQVQKYPDDGQKAYTVSRGILVDIFAGDAQHDRDAAALDAASGSTVEGLRRLLNDLGSYYDQARELALTSPDSLGQAEAALVQHVETSTNPIARAVIPNFGRARMRELFNLTRWSMMEASLAEVLGGDQALLAVLDPLSNQPFEMTVLEKDIFELRSRTNLRPEMTPVLRVMKGSEPNR